MRTGLTIALTAALCLAASGCKKEPSQAVAVMPPDPWESKLAERRKDYQANEQRLLADWREALKEAKSGQPDAAKLLADIVALTGRLEENTATLDKWSEEVSLELQRRGGK